MKTSYFRFWCKKVKKCFNLLPRNYFMDKLKSLLQNPTVMVGLSSITAATTLFYLCANKQKEQISENQQTTTIDPTVKYVSLCQRFGEEEALQFILEGLFKAFSSDSQLKHYFVGTNKNHIEKQFVQQIQIMFGSSKVAYDLTSLQAVHQKLHISDQQFDLVLHHFQQVSSQFGISQKEIDDAFTHLQALRPQIVNPNSLNHNDRQHQPEKQSQVDAPILHKKLDPSIKVVPLSETLGGDDIVKMIAEEFFSKLSSDKTLSAFFQDVNKKVRQFELKPKVVKLVQVLFGSPNVVYSGRNVKDAHSNLNITDQHFDCIVAHLEASFETFGIDSKETQEGKALLETVRSEIVKS